MHRRQNLHKRWICHNMIYFHNSRPNINFFNSNIFRQFRIYSTYNHYQWCTVEVWITCAYATGLRNLTRLVFCGVLGEKLWDAMSLRLVNEDAEGCVHFVGVGLAFGIVVDPKCVGKFEIPLTILKHLLNLAINNIIRPLKPHVYNLPLRQYNLPKLNPRKKSQFS